MDGDRLHIDFLENDEHQRTLLVEGHAVDTVSDLLAAAPDLTKPERLAQYCNAVNYLARGYQFRIIDDPDTYRAKYESRLQSEDPHAPFQEGVVRLRDFGLCDTSEIQPPRKEDGTVVFYVEDDYLAIPYRVTAPSSEQPDQDVVYDPLPMSPIDD